MSSSTTAQNTATTTQDQRQAVQGGTAINAGGGKVMTTASKQGSNGVNVSSGSGTVNLMVTSGAAFDLAQHTVDTLAGALNQTQINAQGATAALSQKLIQIGIPAAVLIYWIGRK